MTKFRVFIEAVDDPENPDLIARMGKLSRHKDERSIRALLANLPAVLAKGMDESTAERVQAYLGEVGAHVVLKPVTPAAKARPAASELPSPAATAAASRTSV